MIISVGKQKKKYINFMIISAGKQKKYINLMIISVGKQKKNTLIL